MIISTMTNDFYTDTILEKEDVCNLFSERTRLAQGLTKGQKLLVFGRRNSGKTSVVKNIVGKDWVAERKNGVFVYLDFFGVQSLDQVLSRMYSGLAVSLKRSFPIQQTLLSALDIIKILRPTLKIDESGSPSIALDLSPGSAGGFENFFVALTQLHLKKHPVCLVFDEFQDIHKIPEAEGLLRDYLQNLPAELPVVLMGSKKHILAQMFSSPKRAFFNWGDHIEFGQIPYEEYTAYINARLRKHKLDMPPQISENLQNSVNRDPEAINRICQELVSTFEGAKLKTRSITDNDVESALAVLLEKRQSSMEEYLRHFTPAEERVLVAFAKQNGRVSLPTGKDFLAKSGLTSGGMKKILDRFVDDAVLYHEVHEFIVSDVFVWRHLKAFRA
jgi:hypothetical protein